VTEVQARLRGLSRAYAATRARNVSRRGEILILLSACFGAAASHFVRVPGWTRWELVAAIAGAAALAILLLRPVAHGVGRFFAAPAPRALARRLDDRMGWHDDVATAAALPGAADPRPLEAFLVAQASGRLVHVEPARLWPTARAHPRLRLFLMIAFVILAILPGSRSIVGRSPGGTEPDDAWMRDHLRSSLRIPDPERAPMRARHEVITDAPLPAAFRADRVLHWDDAEPVPLPPVSFAAGERVAFGDDVALDAIEALKDRMTEGDHVAWIVATPKGGPWRAPVESNRLIVRIGPGGGGGGAAAPQPKETPPPPQAQEAPRPQAPDGEKPPEPPPTPGPTDVVTPLIDEGERVRKDEAIVAVRDPHAGTKPPDPVPLETALRDFDRIVETAVPPERFRPSDREFLKRYFEALRKAVERRAVEQR
jgi:hypothetical protein